MKQRPERASEVKEWEMEKEPRKYKGWKPPKTHYMGIEIPEKLRACAECAGDLGAMDGRQYFMRDTKDGGEERICNHCAKALSSKPAAPADGQR